MDIFQALADPSRRSIVGQLRHNDELSISAMCQTHTMSRQALTKHLNKLIAAGIITKRKQGKQSLHSLNPESLKPLAEWLQPYAALWDVRLKNLQNFIEESE